MTNPPVKVTVQQDNTEKPFCKLTDLNVGDVVSFSNTTGSTLFVVVDIFPGPSNKLNIEYKPRVVVIRIDNPESVSFEVWTSESTNVVRHHTKLLELSLRIGHPQIRTTP
jgi:hypothetical protein